MSGERRVSLGEFVGILAMGFVYAMIGAVITAGLVMLLLGAAHSHSPEVPAWGFATVFWVVAAVRVAVEGVKVSAE